jgi:hypothetical protein
VHEVVSKIFASNAPDPLHLTQNSCIGAFRTVSLLHESRCKTGRTGAIIAQVRLIKSRQNFSQRTHPIHSIGPKTHVFGRFRPFQYCTKVVEKLAELVPLLHKFAKQSRVGIFRNECTSSTPLTQNSCFGAFRTVSLVHESRCKKVTELAPLVHEVVLEFFESNAPDPLHWTQNSCFGAFRTVSLLQESRCKTSRTGAVIAQLR